MNYRYLLLLLAGTLSQDALAATSELRTCTREQDLKVEFSECDTSSKYRNGKTQMLPAYNREILQFF